MYIARSMTPNPVCVRPETLLPELRAILIAKRVRHLPVTDAEGRLVGMVSDRDVRSASPSTVLAPLQPGAASDRLEQVRADDIMSRHPVSLSVEGTIDDALLLFDRHRIGALPVVGADGRVAGIVTVRDVLATYRKLFGIGVPGSSLVEVLDDDGPHLLSRIAAALEEHDIPCARLVRVERGEGGPGAVYARVQTYNIHAVHQALRAAGLETTGPRVAEE